jgi:hypothetical protein
MQSEQRSRVHVFDVDQAVAEIITEAVAAYLDTRPAKWKPGNKWPARKLMDEFISWRVRSGFKGLRAIEGFRKFKAGNADRDQPATRRAV